MKSGELTIKNIDLRWDARVVYNKYLKNVVDHNLSSEFDFLRDFDDKRVQLYVGVIDGEVVCGASVNCLDFNAALNFLFLNPDAEPEVLEEFLYMLYDRELCKPDKYTFTKVYTPGYEKNYAMLQALDNMGYRVVSLTKMAYVGVEETMRWFSIQLLAHCPSISRDGKEYMLTAPAVDVLAPVVDKMTNKKTHRLLEIIRELPLVDIKDLY